MHIVTCMSVTIDGFWIGFIDLLYTRLGNTSNYSATANLYNSQITTAPANPFSARSVFTSSCLVTASNNGYSSCSMLKSFLNGCSLPNVCSCSRCSPYEPPARTTVENHVSTVPPLLRVGTCFFVIFAEKRMLFQSRSLATALSLAPQILL
jgi:hypothetical protein